MGIIMALTESASRLIMFRAGNCTWCIVRAQQAAIVFVLLCAQLIAPRFRGWKQLIGGWRIWERLGGSGCLTEVLVRAVVVAWEIFQPHPCGPHHIAACDTAADVHHFHRSRRFKRDSTQDRSHSLFLSPKWHPITSVKFYSLEAR